MISATSKIIVALALCFAVGLAHPSCQSKRMLLARTKFSDDCQEACMNYTGDHRECAAWEHSAKAETCHGYILDRTEQYRDRYTHCKRISGAFLENFSDNYTYAEGSLPADDEGCAISVLALGLTRTKELCESACISLDSSIYGGCAGWLWNDENHKCGGLLSTKGSGKQCGSS